MCSWGVRPEADCSLLNQQFIPSFQLLHHPLFSQNVPSGDSSSKYHPAIILKLWIGMARCIMMMMATTSRRPFLK